MAGYEAIIIPGGGVDDSGRVYPWFAARLEKAYSQFTRAEIIIVLSRGTTHKAPPLNKDGYPVTEAKAGAQFLLKKGIPAESLRVEEVSYDTIGNAYFSRLLYTDPLKLRKLLIINSEFHMPRTKAIFEWVYSLGVRDSAYELSFISTENVGLDDEALAARVAKEAKSLESFLKLREEIASLSQLHNWIYTSHDAYKIKPANTSEPPSHEELVLKSY